MFAGLTTAIRTLSIIPVPGNDAEDISSSLSWFGLVGAILGLILYWSSLLLDAITRGSWSYGVAIIVLIIGIILTGGLHLDGLADWADGIGGGSDKARTLEIMKDSQVGAFGVLALVTVLIVKWIALSRLVDFGLTIWIVAAYVISRLMQVELAFSLPYARQKEGVGKVFIENARPLRRMLAFSSGLVIILVLCGPLVIIFLVLGWLFCKAFGLWCYRRIGGVTGDLLGACSEITEMIILFLSAGAAKILTEYTGWNFLL